MSDDTRVEVQRKLTRKEQRQIDAKNRLSSPAASVIAILVAILWTTPTAGLLVTSFRQPLDISRSGWWTAVSNPDFSMKAFGEAIAQNPLNFSSSGWLMPFTDPHFSLDNYAEALDTHNLGMSFVNSFIITIPAVIIPIILALLAAYAFAWIDFKGRNILFAFVFSLQVVPIQVTLVPLLGQYTAWHLQNTLWTLWLSHTIFGLPLAIYLLHNFMKEIPRSLIEAARVDGAGHVRVFFQVLLPLLVPAIASFGIFQFLWVWNDLLVSLTFAAAEDAPITRIINEMVGSFGSKWYLLSAGAFISMAVPVVVFLALQRYFVRGLLAGGVKG